MAMADALMSLAGTGLFAAKWTRAIEAGWMSSVEERRPDLVGRLGYRRDQMRDAVPDWEVAEQAWHAVAGGVVLPDLDDVHVLAAALAAAVASFKRMRARWKRPQATIEDFAAAFERGGMPATAQRLREAGEIMLRAGPVAPQGASVSLV